MPSCPSPAYLTRTSLLLGEEAMERIARTKVIIFGVGGVGSWCAEALVRSGIRQLTLVDQDLVSESNCNRQLMATSATVGRAKVEVMRERLLEISPLAQIGTVQGAYNAQTAESFHIESYDFVIDAIDSLKDKADLIVRATSISKAMRRGELSGEGIAESLTLISSMGAALRIDPTKVRTAEFWSVSGDPLAKVLRKKFKSTGEYPACKFTCVYSEEPAMANLGTPDPEDNCAYKVQTNGTLCHVTAIFGLTIAGTVLQKLALG